MNEIEDGPDGTFELFYSPFDATKDSLTLLILLSFCIYIFKASSCEVGPLYLGSSENKLGDEFLFWSPPIHKPDA